MAIDLIREAAADLPIDQAKAVWLIDVCGCSYDQGADAVGVDRPEFAARVGNARRAIRHSIAVTAR